MFSSHRLIMASSASCGSCRRACGVPSVGHARAPAVAGRRRLPAEHVGFTPKLLDDLEEAGLRLIVSTCNTLGQLAYAGALPAVDGIHTDFPQRLPFGFEEHGR